ncbi:MAG: tRNA epoxyqueuosine(34) reductase QueG [Proteobacteria bacterium]|nr:tRNA epoxyqueuosine(34) reductase QueG [Pseudomonadota bacterium]
MSPEAGRDLVLALARENGFDACGIAPANASPLRESQLLEWLDAGMEGEMDWMAREPEKRASPPVLWPEARSVIMLGTNYGPAEDPLAMLAEKDRASLSLYAIRKDYHDIIKTRLKAVARAFAEKTGAGVKVFVDTAPVMEKPLAMEAGLGWQGKHSVLVSREFGNWLFLGAIYTTMPLSPDAPEKDHCGSCRRCLDICPTDAFPAPYQLDPRRCIAYLTIEHKGPIAADLRAGIGNRVFGCDDCLAICPWNKFAEASRDTKLVLRNELQGLRLADLARLDDAAFRALFAGTPIKRTGRDRFIRNVLIAIGNSGDPGLAKEAIALLDDSSPLVRGMAIWALARLQTRHVLQNLAKTRREHETDAHVLAEWRVALEGMGEAECAS